MKKLLSIVLLSAFTLLANNNVKGGGYITTDESLESVYNERHSWGLLTSIDLHNCDPDLVRSETAIKSFVEQLCILIDMKRFGDTIVINFGEDERVAGYSMLQLIETSLISGHFANATNAVYLDIFSCKYYNPFEAAKFAQFFFAASDHSMTTFLRK